VGPLSVLKNIWINQRNFPTSKNKCTAEFLKDLRDKLETARPYSGAHAVSAQQRYIIINGARKNRSRLASLLVLQKRFK